MMMRKTLAAGSLGLALLATPAMAQVVIQEPGVVGYSYPSTAYIGTSYGYSMAPGPGYYGARGFRPAPRVGAFATAPWDDGSYGYYGYVAAPY